MTPRAASIFAVVELASLTGLVAAAVFLVVFAIVCIVAWWLLRMLRPGSPGPTTWELNFTHQLPVSGSTAGRIADITERAMRRPDIAPETRARLDALRETRQTVASFYRSALTLIGLAGAAAAVALFTQADSANMLGLPAAIILLLSLGALLKGVIPSRTVKPLASLDPSLFRNVHVEVASNQPLTINLGESDMAKAMAMLREGASPDAIARALHPQYDALGNLEKRAVEQALSQALRSVAARSGQH
jgi:hypothetical protein